VNYDAVNTNVQQLIEDAFLIRERVDVYSRELDEVIRRNNNEGYSGPFEGTRQVFYARQTYENKLKEWETIQVELRKTLRWYEEIQKQTWIPFCTEILSPEFRKEYVLAKIWSNALHQCMITLGIELYEENL
jgi:hypothetical protein